jgi:hypothetical protein
MISSAEVRLALDSQFNITALSHTHEELIPELEFNLDRQNLRGVEVG